MSNANVGNIYNTIIQDVMEASRVDFEEGGIEESVLEELKKGWQKRLTQQQLAVFPWDPKPEPIPTPAASAPAPQLVPVQVQTPTQAPHNGAAYSQPQQPAALGLTMPMPGGHPTGNTYIKSEPGVKIEPGLEGTPAMSQGAGQAIAQERVIAQLQNQYGERAAASINKVRRQPVNATQQQGQQRPVNQSMPQQYPGQYQGSPPQQNRQAMYPTPQQQQQQQIQQQQQQQRPQMANGQRPPPSQQDGAGDADGHVGVLYRQGAAGENTEMGRIEIDQLLHAQIAARAKAMEGGGVMVPLKKRSCKNKAVSHHSKPAGSGGPSRFDGLDDDLKEEEEDEDAINSDLDDPEDNYEEDDEDDDAGEIMLCMYDKVQRVKNKWKCVLKDGVLNVNGKDYVFHKATGEYEW
ncbi:Uu.00g028160.m01.CDS01 [Anthostomella pinea]|uniref:Uu.00g028160.m01.CDS01 n=1 Tax=Anthostomella pinea TaxID=933095 RepID=A0AAI8V7X1_9PEZI|nr:Uu.00g028160.m01.CDS01 [Anthostomella pinea]